MGYEYKEIVADGQLVSLLLDGYESFGWEVNNSLPDSSTGGKLGSSGRTVIQLKRDRKILNKAELTRLQRNFEACVSEIQTLDGRKTSVASTRYVKKETRYYINLEVLYPKSRKCHCVRRGIYRYCHWTEIFDCDKVMICDRSDFRLEKAKTLEFAVCNNSRKDLKTMAIEHFGKAPSRFGPTADAGIYIDAAGAESILELYQSMLPYPKHSQATTNYHKHWKTWNVPKVVESIKRHDTYVLNTAG